MNRWTRGSHDRLYVRANGTDRGYVDLKTGQPRPKNGLAWPDHIGVEVGRWLRNNGYAAHAPRWPTTITQPLTVKATDHPRSSRRQAGTRESVSAEPRRAGEPTAVGPAATDGVGPTAQPVRPAESPASEVTSDRAADADRPWDDLARNRPGHAAFQAARNLTTGWSRLGRLFGFRTKDASWRTGGRGERLVGRTLWWARLFGWHSLHAIPVGEHGADIDHLLIGPGGVLTINTKHHRGATVKAGREVIFVRGLPTQYAAKSLREARRATDALTRATGDPVRVRPLIVVVGAVRIRGRRTRTVRVLARRSLLWHLLWRRGHLTTDQQNQLYETARRSTTWTDTQHRRTAHQQRQ
ncbi:MAG: nuclease-related domain-containing protein [Stackebrandtia sp.]